jgi:Type II secretion system (T2SS), protein M subtype b
MRAFRSLSDWFHALSRRERLFVWVGVVVSTAALVVTLVALPLVDRWTAREAAYAANREQWTRLQALVSSEENLRRALDEQRRARRGTMELLLTGATPALAASNLQVLLQQYAEESLVQLNRVDVAGQPKPAGPGLVAVPVVLQGQGDIYGLVDFLSRVQHGDRLLVIDEISVSTRSFWRRGDLLVWSLRAHGLYPTPAGSS